MFYSTGNTGFHFYSDFGRKLVSLFAYPVSTVPVPYILGLETGRQYFSIISDDFGGSNNQTIGIGYLGLERTEIDTGTIQFLIFSEWSLIEKIQVALMLKKRSPSYADPCHFDAHADPAFHVNVYRTRIRLFTLMRIQT
jgi:hypothetical protein